MKLGRIILIAAFATEGCSGSTQDTAQNFAALNSTDFKSTEGSRVRGFAPGFPTGNTTANVGYDAPAPPPGFAPSYPTASYDYADYETDEQERVPFDESQARDAARSELRRKSYSRVGRTGLCTDDCSGHEAGFEWAKDNRITRRSNCYMGDSPSFDEGCEAYVQAMDREVEEWTCNGFAPVT